MHLLTMPAWLKPAAAITTNMVTYVCDIPAQLLATRPSGLQPAEPSCTDHLCDAQVLTSCWTVSCWTSVWQQRRATSYNYNVHCNCSQCLLVSNLLTQRRQAWLLNYMSFLTLLHMSCWSATCWTLGRRRTADGSCFDILLA